MVLCLLFVNFTQGIGVGDPICILKSSIMRFEYDNRGRGLVVPSTQKLFTVAVVHDDDGGGGSANVWMFTSPQSPYVEIVTLKVTVLRGPKELSHPFHHVRAP